MPETAPPGLLELYFPALVGGSSVVAPPRTLQDPTGRAIWRETLNMISRDGATYGRPGVAVGSTPLSQPPYIMGTGDAAFEIPRWIHVSARAAVDSSSQSSDFYAIVTDRNIFIRPSYLIGWINCTPTYAVGTVTATNGSPNITGAGGTQWQTLNITGSQWILIDSRWYQISSVGSDTTITLASNFQGATGGGKAYTIRRTFIGGGIFDSKRILHCLIYNENLYVAGTYIGGATGAARPAVIKVADIYSATPTTTYLTADRLLQTGLDYISDLTRIVGIKALQDGRIVLGGNFNEVFYSSNLSDAVWTVAPGGRNPLAEMSDHMEAVGHIGTALTFHFATGIVYGYPQAVANEPLAFQRSDADYGTIAPLTLRPYRGGEVFLAVDGDVKFFDGRTTRSLGNGEMRRMTRDLNVSLPFNSNQYANYHAQVYEGREEYTLFRAGTQGTKFWTYTQATDSWWAMAYAHDIGAMSEVLEIGGVTPDNQAVLGLQSDPILGGILSGFSLVFYREGVGDDVVLTTTYELHTDDLDHQYPLWEKVPARVIVWPIADMTGLVVAVRKATDTTYTITVSKDMTAKKPKNFDFLPGELAGIQSSFAHRYRISGADLRKGVFALFVRVALVGSVEANAL